MAEEYYIRQPEADNARGPFNLSKLAGMAETGQIDLDTLIYHEEEEEWLAIGSSEELKQTIFPEKKKLGLKVKSDEDLNLLNVDEDEDDEETIAVADLLAAAEGDTEETKHIKEKAIWQDKAAALAIPSIGVIMILSAITHIYPSIDIVQTVIDDEDYMLLLRRPLILVGALDLFFAISLFLSVTEIYPLLRLRAMVGLGYFGFLHWATWQTGDQMSLYLMVSSIGAGMGIFICTLTLNFMLMASFAVFGILGVGSYLYFTVIQ